MQDFKKLGAFYLGKRFDAAELDLEPADLELKPEPGAEFVTCPAALAKPANYQAWERDLKRWLRVERPIAIYRSTALKENSQANESERHFRIRLQQFANEARNLKVAQLRKRYDAQSEELVETLVKPKRSEIEVTLVSLGWEPSVLSA